MKQEISITQLGELSVKTLDEYRKFSKEKGWINPHGETTWNIGQMIEFIDWYLQFPDITEEPNHCDHCSPRFQLEFYIDPKHNSYGHGVKKWWVQNEELCDALWEATKEILEAEVEDEIS